MRYRKKDGVILESVRADREGRKTLPGLPVRFLMVFAGVYGTLFLLVDGLELTVDEPVLMLAIAGITAVLCAAFALRRYLWFSVSLSFLCLSLYLIREWDLVRDGFWHLLNAYVDRYNDYMGAEVPHYATSAEEERALLFFLISVVYFDAMLFVMSFYGVISRYLLLLATIPFFGAGLTVGAVPSAVPFLCYLGSMLFLAAARASADSGSWEIRRTVSAAGLAAVAAGALLLVLFDRLLGEDGYPEEAVRERKLEALAAMEEFPPEDLSMWMEYSAFPELTRALDDMGMLQLFGAGSTGDGGLAGGRLGRVDRVEFEYETALRVTLPDRSGGFYLRGYVGANYTGNRWDGLDREQEEQILALEQEWEERGYPFDTQNQIAEFYRILREHDELRTRYSDALDAVYTTYFTEGIGAVDVISANPYFYYLPYGADSSSLEKTGERLYAAPIARAQEYSFSYYSYSSGRGDFPEVSWYYPSYWGETGVEEMDAWIEAEEDYAALIEELFLQVPEDTQSGLESVIAELEDRVEAMEEVWENGLSYMSEEDSVYQDYMRLREIMITIEAVRGYLERNMTYTLAPGRLPVGEDFVSYFLTESGQGYCSHFASAGVILLRLLGVPARYAEGYLVSGSDIAAARTAGRQDITEYKRYDSNERVTNLEITVLDANAHAWAEVYLRGYGWIPVELTAGYEDAMWGQNPAIEEAQEGEQESTAEEESSGDVTESGTVQEETEQEETAAQSTQETQDEEETQNASEENPEPEEGSEGGLEPGGAFFRGMRLLILVLAAAAAAAVLVLAGRMIRKRIRERIDSDERNEAVLFLYGRVLRMLGAMKMIPKLSEDAPEYGAQIGNQLDAIIRDGTDAERFMEIVIRAGYSGRMITEEERNEAVRFYEELRRGYYAKASPIRRLCSRFLWNL